MHDREELQTYQAKLGDRLDSIYAQHYKDIKLCNSYKSGYNAFILANKHLLTDKDFNGVCKGGEVIYLPYLTIEQNPEVVLGIWE